MNPPGDAKAAAEAAFVAKLPPKAQKVWEAGKAGGFETTYDPRTMSMGLTKGDHRFSFHGSKVLHNGQREMSSFDETQDALAMASKYPNDVHAFRNGMLGRVVSKRLAAGKPNAAMTFNNMPWGQRKSVRADITLPVGYEWGVQDVIQRRL